TAPRFRFGIYRRVSDVCTFFFFFQAEDGIRDDLVTGVQTCALPISIDRRARGVDLARERITGGAEAGAREALGRGVPLLLDLDLHGVAVWLHRREPFGAGPAELRGRGVRFERTLRAPPPPECARPHPGAHGHVAA